MFHSCASFHDEITYPIYNLIARVYRGLCSITAAIYPESNYFGSAKIVGEVKYEPMMMNIFGERGNITINNEITPSGYTFRIDGV